MKKKLEGELISIAHRVLKLKNRSETVQLQLETKNLYDQLTVLRFYEENFETLKNEISQEQLEKKLEQFDTNSIVESVQKEEKHIIEEEPKVVVEKTILNEVEKVIEEPKNDEIATAEDIDKIVAEMSKNKVFLNEPTLTNDVAENNKTSEPQQISFEELLGESYKEPDFVRVEDTPKEVEQAADLIFDRKEEVVEEKNEVVEKAAETIFERANELPIPEKKEELNFETTKTTENQEVKSKSLNDKLTKGINFGLNDRIAFEKKLFGGSSDDFNRVVSQLNTFDSFAEASSFIIGFVKPDYKNWEGQEEYETRFLEIIEKKFN